MTTSLRQRRVRAGQPEAEEVCLLTTEDGQRRKADTQKLFSYLAEQSQAENTNEWVFKGDPTSLWDEVSLFVDEESECCPFYTYEQIERPDGVMLRVIRGAQPEE